MFRMLANLIKGKVKAKFGRPLNGGERFILTSLYSKVDRVASALVAGNVFPQLIDPSYDFTRLTSSVSANLELFEKLLNRFPKFDAIMTASWLGLIGCGQVEMGTTMRVTPWVEPSPEVYALDRHSLAEIPMPEMKGYLETNIRLCGEVQDRYPNIISPPILLGSWDLAMMLRGDKLIRDFRLFKDHTETTDPDRKKKIEARGDPAFFTRLLEFTTEASISIGNLYKEQGVKMLGTVIVNQFANPPLISTKDFIMYLYPYVEQVWRAFKRYHPMAGYMPSSPALIKEVIKYPAVSGLACFNNYMFPQNALGITAPQYDEEMLGLSQQIRTAYQYIVHGKFLRDATEHEIETQVIRVCQMAVTAGVPLSIGLTAVPPGTDLAKVDLVQDVINKNGVYP